MARDAERMRAQLDRSVAGGQLQEVASGVHLLPGFGNCTIVEGSDGIAVIDPGLFVNGPRVVRQLRKPVTARDVHPLPPLRDRNGGRQLGAETRRVQLDEERSLRLQRMKEQAFGHAPRDCDQLPQG